MFTSLLSTQLQLIEQVALRPSPALTSQCSRQNSSRESQVYQNGTRHNILNKARWSCLIWSSSGSAISSISKLCGGEFCGAENPPYLTSHCSSSSHTPWPQACHTLALQSSMAPSSFGNKYKVFFFLNLVFYGTCCLNSAYLRALSPATLLLTLYPLVQPDFSFPVTPCTFQPLCLCSACACCRVCPFPLSLWKFDSFLTASSESLLLSEVPLLPRIRCDPFHLLYTLHLILWTSASTVWKHSCPKKDWPLPLGVCNCCSQYAARMSCSSACILCQATETGMPGLARTPLRPCLWMPACSTTGHWLVPFSAYI